MDLREEIKGAIKQYCPFRSEEIKPPENSEDFSDYPPEELIGRIDELFNNTYDAIKKQKLPSLSLPLVRDENIVYDQYYNLFYGKKTRKISFGGKYNDYSRILSVAQVVKQLLQKGIHATKREIFYSDVNGFERQKYSDRAIHDLALYLNTTRENLNIVAAMRGTCMGSLILKDNNEKIDLRDSDVGWTISPFQDQIHIMDSDADFILVVEKASTLVRLSEERIWKQTPCILLTSQGFPSYASRRFLKRLITELEIPAFGLADADPYGFTILLTYACGGISAANETPNLAVNNLYWLGVHPEDFDHYDIDRYTRLPMVSSDFERGKYLHRHPCVKNCLEIKKKIDHLMKLKVKVEIQALSAMRKKNTFDFISYIVEKIKSGSFVRFG